MEQMNLINGNLYYNDMGSRMDDKEFTYERAAIEEHRHAACAANGHPCPAFRIHRSKTPLAAQIRNLCSEYPCHPLNPWLNLWLRRKPRWVHLWRSSFVW